MQSIASLFLSINFFQLFQEKPSKNPRLRCIINQILTGCNSKSFKLRCILKGTLHKQTLKQTMSNTETHQNKIYCIMLFINHLLAICFNSINHVCMTVDICFECCMLLDFHLICKIHWPYNTVCIHPILMYLSSLFVDK